MDTIETLSQKLKKSMVRSLRNVQNPDNKYLASNKGSWTANELADEIENETEIGIKRMTSILNLAVYMLNKSKKING